MKGCPAHASGHVGDTLWTSVQGLYHWEFVTTVLGWESYKPWLAAEWDTFLVDTISEHPRGSEREFAHKIPCTIYEAKAGCSHLNACHVRQRVIQSVNCYSSDYTDENPYHLQIEAFRQIVWNPLMGITLTNRQVWRLHRWVLKCFTHALGCESVVISSIIFHFCAKTSCMCKMNLLSNTHKVKLPSSVTSTCNTTPS